MKKYRVTTAIACVLVVLGVGAFFLVSPFQVQLLPSGIIEDSISETGYACLKHQIPLVSERGFYASGSVVQGTNDYNQVAGDYPCSIPLNGSLTESQIHRVPALLTYCRQCESEIHHHFAKATSAEKAAVRQLDPVMSQKIFSELSP